jgi:hypothetical protein
MLLFYEMNNIGIFFKKKKKKKMCFLIYIYIYIYIGPKKYSGVFGKDF